MMTKVKKCTCKHEEQDKLYGAKNRVHNHTQKPEGHKWRCTVCGEER